MVVVVVPPGPPPASLVPPAVVVAAAVRRSHSQHGQQKGHQQQVESRVLRHDGCQPGALAQRNPATGRRRASSRALYKSQECSGCR